MKPLILWLHQWCVEQFEILGYEYEEIHWHQLPKFVREDARRLEGYS